MTQLFALPLAQPFGDADHGEGMDEGGWEGDGIF